MRAESSASREERVLNGSMLVIYAGQIDDMQENESCDRSDDTIVDCGVKI
jgi:hypothetical protein